jgi:hypothetical protein
MIYEYQKWLSPIKSIATRHASSLHDLISNVSSEAVVFWDKYVEDTQYVMPDDIVLIRLVRPSMSSGRPELQLYREKYSTEIIQIFKWANYSEWRLVWSREPPIV